MGAQKTILRNFPHNDLFDDDSFLGKLHEEELWDINEYWLLEWSIYEIEDNFFEKFHWEIFRIFSMIMCKISYHLDKHDGFKIKNLKRRKVYELRERVQLVFEGYFSKSMPSQNIFEEANPLLNFSI